MTQPDDLFHSPWGQQITDRVPGTDEHFGLVAPQHRGFTGWYGDVYIHLHGLTVVIWEELVCTHSNMYQHLSNLRSSLIYLLIN